VLGTHAETRNLVSGPPPERRREALRCACLVTRWIRSGSRLDPNAVRRRAKTDANIWCKLTKRRDFEEGSPPLRPQRGVSTTDFEVEHHDFAFGLGLRSSAFRIGAGCTDWLDGRTDLQGQSVVSLAI
jgi:hypothetical protein